MYFVPWKIALACCFFIHIHNDFSFFCSYCTFFLRVYVYQLKYRENRTNYKQKRRRDLLKIYMNQTKKFRMKHQASEENERWLAIWQNSVVHRLIFRQNRHSAVKRGGIYATVKLKWSANPLTFSALVMYLDMDFQSVLQFSILWQLI